MIDLDALGQIYRYERRDGTKYRVVEEADFVAVIAELRASRKAAAAIIEARWIYDFNYHGYVMPVDDRNKILALVLNLEALK